jgi:hypothetical protein
MFKRYLTAPIIIVIIITAVFLAWFISATRPESAGKESAQSTGTQLKVSNTGTQTTTDVSGADLQQAAPPSRSASSADVTPQQSTPNYCSAGEVPYQDGCIPAPSP